MDSVVASIKKDIESKLLDVLDELSAEDKQKVDEFKDVRFLHPQLSSSFKELLEAYNCMEPGDFILVAGSTGVGKSALAEQFKLHLQKNELEKMEADLNYNPVVYQNAYQSESGSFDFKLFYENISVATGDILINEKQLVEFLPSGAVDVEAFRKKNKTVRQMRKSVENSFERRETHTLLIDEIQHMLSLNGADQLKDRMDFIKSFTESAQVRIIMFGNYDALKMSSLSAQLGRRENLIDFPRYKCLTEQELEDWVNVVWNCQKHLPLKYNDTLVNHYKYLLQYSCGCTGILKKWLNRALIKTLSQGKQEITKSILEATRLPDKKLSQIAREIAIGEKKLEMTGVDEVTELFKGACVDFLSDDCEEEQEPAKPKKKTKKKPGEQNPKRHKVGR